MGLDTREVEDKGAGHGGVTGRKREDEEKDPVVGGRGGRGSFLVAVPGFFRAGGENGG